jgi:hypothetical protein
MLPSGHLSNYYSIFEEVQIDQHQAVVEGEFFGVDILIQRGGKAIRTKMILLFDEDS